MGWTAGVRLPQQGQDFSLLHSVQTACGPTQPPIQWVPGAISGDKVAGEWLTTHLRLLPRSRIVELYLRSIICLHGIVVPAFD
jgi:hypothetical protein